MAFSSLIGSALIMLSSAQSAPMIADNAVVNTINEEYVISTVNKGNGSVKYSVDGTVLSGDIKVEAGKTVTINANANLFYKVESVVCNVSSVVLTESTATTGEYTFVMPDSDVAFTYTFATDNATIEQLNKWYESIKAGNWKEVFSVSNIMTFISTLFNGGILIAIIRYVIKDKAIASKLEKTVSENMEKLIPEQSKKIILEAFESVLTPIFNNILEQTAKVEASQATLVRVISLMQENTPESKVAILNELQGLQISDSTLIEQIKEYITKQNEALQKQLEEALAKLEEIEKSNAEKIVETETEETEESENTTTPIE